MKQKYTNNQIYNIYDKYVKEGSQSLVKFANTNKIPIGVLRYHFKKLNLKLIPQKIVNRKFQIDENFFEIIDSEEKAYILGFLYADGNNNDKNHKVCLSLSKKDEDILIKISKIIFSNNINIINTKNNTMSNLNIINKKISNDLTKHGCVPNKTFLLKFPELNKKLYNHFIRGYFDGDGMLTITNRLYRHCKNYSSTANFSITSTKEMLTVIQNIFENMKIHAQITKRYKNRNNNNYTLRVSGNHNIKKIGNYIYNNATIYLNRKYKNYLLLCNLCLKTKQKIPENIFLETYNSCSSVKEISKKLNLSVKQIKKRIKKLKLNCK